MKCSRWALGPSAVDEALHQVEGRDRLVVEGRRHCAAGDDLFRDVDLVDDRVGAAAVLKRSIVEDVALGRRGHHETRTPGWVGGESGRALFGPALGQQPIVFDRGGLGHETGREAVFGILDQLLVDLHLILLRDHLVVGLVRLFTLREVSRTSLGVEDRHELGRQRCACLVHNDTHAVGATGGPDHQVVLVEHAQLQERAAEAYA